MTSLLIKLYNYQYALLNQQVNTGAILTLTAVSTVQIFCNGIQHMYETGNMHSPPLLIH